MQRYTNIKIIIAFKRNLNIKNDGNNNMLLPTLVFNEKRLFTNNLKLCNEII